MRALLVLLVLLPLAWGWSQCGAPSGRAAALDTLDVRIAESPGGYRIDVVVRGTAHRPIPAAAEVAPLARLGAIMLPLPRTPLGREIAPGPFEYTYHSTVDAPAHLVTHLRLTVEHGGEQLVCVRGIDLAIP